MANRILTNGEENKILTSVGNRIIKQPYEFGNAFQNRMGLNNYFTVPSINIPIAWSWLVIASVPSTNNQGILQSISVSSNIADNFMIRGTQSIDNLHYIIDIIDNFSSYMGAVSAGINPLRYLYNDEFEVNTYNSATKKVVTQLISKSTVLRDRLVIAASGPFSSNSTARSNFLSTDTKLNRLYLFDRKLTLAELIYLESNRLFSDLQSRVGLFGDYIFNKAEILDFSPMQNGSDMRVGCRDISGNNRHAELMSLPAGTIEQKVDYANANLFVPFIQ